VTFYLTCRRVGCLHFNCSLGPSPYSAQTWLYPSPATWRLEDLIRCWTTIQASSHHNPHTLRVLNYKNSRTKTGKKYKKSWLEIVIILNDSFPLEIFRPLKNIGHRLKWQYIAWMRSNVKVWETGINRQNKKKSCTSQWYGKVKGKGKVVPVIFLN